MPDEPPLGHDPERLARRSRIHQLLLSDADEPTKQQAMRELFGPPPDPHKVAGPYRGFLEYLDAFRRVASVYSAGVPPAIEKVVSLEVRMAAHRLVAAWNELDYTLWWYYIPELEPLISGLEWFEHLVLNILGKSGWHPRVEFLGDGTDYRMWWPPACGVDACPTPLLTPGELRALDQLLDFLPRQAFTRGPHVSADVAGPNDLPPTGAAVGREAATGLGRQIPPTAVRTTQAAVGRFLGLGEKYRGLLDRLIKSGVLSYAARPAPAARSADVVFADPRQHEDFRRFVATNRGHP